MSDAFTGFSEDDIKKAQNGIITNKVTENESKQIKSALKGRKSPSKLNETKTKRVLFSKTVSAENVLIPDEAKLNKSVPVRAEQTKEDRNISELEEQSTRQMPDIESAHEGTNARLPEKKFVDLEEFQARQKLIEEQNRRRKELLAKALADRTKRTQEETHRLNEIKNEFKKLDVVLSNDVKILRQQIEIASIEYMEARKKYHKIEKEFLDVKLSLQQKLEKKEMLTEHLCAIIEQNEERKARKLTELWEKLELKADMPSTNVQNEDDKLSDNQLQVAEVTSTDVQADETIS